MLSTAEIAQYVHRHVTFMHGWTLTVYEGRWEGPHLQIAAKVPNAYRPDDTVDLDIHCSIPPMRDYDQLDNFLVWKLARCWSHEVREFYRVDGNAPFDPHAANSDRDQ